MTPRRGALDGVAVRTRAALLIAGVIAVPLAVVLWPRGGEHTSPLRVRGVTYSVGVARDYIVPESAISPYGTIEGTAGVTLGSQTAYAVTGVDPATLLVARLAPGQSDSGGPLGDTAMLLTDAAAAHALCPFVSPDRAIADGCASPPPSFAPIEGWQLVEWTLGDLEVQVPPGWQRSEADGGLALYPPEDAFPSGQSLPAAIHVTIEYGAPTAPDGWLAWLDRDASRPYAKGEWIDLPAGRARHAFVGSGPVTSHIDLYAIALGDGRVYVVSFAYVDPQLARKIASTVRFGALPTAVP